MSEKKEVVEAPKYKLKSRYDGISLGFNKGRVFNATMTEKQAKELKKSHPKGIDLFEIYTEAPVKTTKTEKAKK